MISNILIVPFLDQDDMMNHNGNYVDKVGHGTFVAGLIINDVCKQVKLYSCTYYDPYDTTKNMWKKLIPCYERAYMEHMDFVNFSTDGEGPVDKEYILIKQILSNPKVKMIVAAGNHGLNLGNPCWGSFPTCYQLDNLINVGNLNPDTSRHNKSNYGTINMEWVMGTNVYSTLPNNQMGFMTGTSMSTAIYTNKLLKQRCLEINK